MSVAESTVPAVSPESPWLGLRPFNEAARPYFFGRETEVHDLFQRVANKPLTVLFGQSGLGKTSLVQAALVPRLREAGFVPVVLRLNIAGGASSLLVQLVQGLVAALAPALPGLAEQVDGLPVKPATAWLLCHDPRFGLIAPGAARPVLVLDQFEEVFTLGQATAERRVDAAEFLGGLADLVENRVPDALRARLEVDEDLADRLDYAARSLKVLLSLREDFLPWLERQRDQMPSLMDNRFELRLLTGPQALQAVWEPGRLRCQVRPEAVPIVSEATAGAIVRFVAGAAPEVPLAEIDAVPPLLSLLCAELNEQRLAAGEALIRPEQLEGRAEDILGQFYERTLAGAPGAVRAFVEDRLLSAQGFRESITLDTATHELAQAGLSGTGAAEAIARLVDARLLTSEERGGVRRIELTHDVLTGVARRSRDARHEREAAARRRRRARSVGLIVGLALLIAGVAVLLAIVAMNERAAALNAKHDAEAKNLALGSLLINLGVLYAKDRGVTQDYAQALDWFRKAATAGRADGMLYLGVMYDNGWGVAKDVTQARDWYRKAAKAGSVAAMNNLGNLYYYGRGVTQDYAQARDWFQKAAAAGEPSAMYNLGGLYEKGLGVAQDYAQARDWYRKAVTAGDDTAREGLSRLSSK